MLTFHLHIDFSKMLETLVFTGFVQNVHFLCDFLKMSFFKEFTYILNKLHISVFLVKW